MNNESAIAEKLLQINAIKLELQTPFTWASGWRSPIYCDNRKSLSFPHVRDFIKSEMSNVIFDSFPDADIIAGVATAGIPWGALVADQIKLPFIYVRSSPKAHGLGNQIEGVLPENAKVVVVEDLISTGKSSMQVVDVLRGNGAQVIGMCAIFTYGFDVATQLFGDQNVPLKTLSNYDVLCKYAADKGMFDAEELKILQSWRSNPSEWQG
jgi:orotate phosphoribosyltransferase